MIGGGTAGGPRASAIFIARLWNSLADILADFRDLRDARVVDEDMLTMINSGDFNNNYI